MVTAITLAFVYLVGAAAYFVYAWYAVADGGSPLLYAIGAIVIWFGVPALAAALWFAIAWVWRTPRPLAQQIGPAATVKLYWNEARAIMRNGPRMAFGWWGMRDPAAAPGAAPILLLHGVLCNGAVWRDWLRDLPARGLGPAYALSYGPPLASIELFAEQAAARIDAILAATGARKVTLVGHSMGGLVARAYLRRYGGAKVRSLITIGSPHHGSVHAGLFPGTSLAEMRPGNPWIEALDRGDAPTVPVLSIWSWHDSMVAPQSSSCLDGATNVDLIGVAHNALLGDPTVVSLAVAELERAAAEAGAQTATSVSPALAAQTPSAPA